MVKGAELIGHAFLQQQTPSKAYSETEDYMLFAEKPAFFTRLDQHHFAILFPTDLHMPNLGSDQPAAVKKVEVNLAV